MRTYRLALGFLTALVACGTSRVAAQAVAPLETSLNPMSAIERGVLKGFIQRPLFDPSRRLPPVAPPPVVAEVQPEAAPEAPPTLHLLGVIQGVREMAVVHRDGEEKTMILRTGDHVGGWSVIVLPSAGIRLHQGSRFYDYAMFTKSTGAAPTAVAQVDLSGKMELSEAMARRNTRLRGRTY